MGIGAQISVSGYVYLTKGANYNMRSKKLAKILNTYPSDVKLSRGDLQKIYSLLQAENVPQAPLNIISPAPIDNRVEEIFFARVAEGAIAAQELLLKHAIAFERDKKAFLEIFSEPDKLIELAVTFVLKDLSAILIEAADKTLENKSSTNIDKLKLISLIIKIHRGYQRVPPSVVHDVCKKVSLLLKKEELNPPLAYKVYSIAGEYLRLEQRYHNPRDPLIPSHLLAQQRVLANLPFWTQDASSIFNFIQPYLSKEVSGEEEAELQEILFYENRELGRIFAAEFTEGGKLQLEDLMWACMSCCIDPRETFGHCLHEFCKNFDTIQKTLKKIANFAIHKLGRIALSTFAKEKPVIDSINRLNPLTEKDLDTVIFKALPILHNKGDFVINGEDSLAYRMIDIAAELMNARGKIIEIPGTIIPLHLLPCNSLIRELKFNQMNAIDLLNEIESYSGLSIEELFGKLKEMGNAAFVRHFVNKEEDRVDFKRMALACVTLCLDQGNTVGDCFWRLVESKEYNSPLHLASEIIRFAVKGVSEMVLPQLEDYPYLIVIQKKYLALSEEQLKEVAEKVMPFIKLEAITKEDLKFNSGDQRLVYAILDSAAEVLGIEVTNNAI